MEQNYTPLELKKFEDNKTTTFLLLLANFTLIILAVVLFLFIQRKLKEKNQFDYQSQTQENPISPLPTVFNNDLYLSPSPTATNEPMLPISSPSPTEIITDEETSLPASPSPTEIIAPTSGESSEQQ